jgi:hypothetical protein
VRPLPLRSAARDSAAAGSSSCLWKFVLVRHRLATSWTLSRRSRTGHASKRRKTRARRLRPRREARPAHIATGHKRHPRERLLPSPSLRRWMGSGRCQRRALRLHTRRRNMAASICHVKSSAGVEHMSVGRGRRTRTQRQKATNRPRYPRPPTTSVGSATRMGRRRRRPGHARGETRRRADASWRRPDCC